MAKESFIDHSKKKGSIQHHFCHNIGTIWTRVEISKHLKRVFHGGGGGGGGGGQFLSKPPCCQPIVTQLSKGLRNFFPLRLLRWQFFSDRLGVPVGPTPTFTSHQIWLKIVLPQKTWGGGGDIWYCVPHLQNRGGRVVPPPPTPRPSPPILEGCFSAP